MLIYSILIHVRNIINAINSTAWKKNGFSSENNEKKNTPKFMKTNLFKGNLLRKILLILSRYYLPIKVDNNQNEKEIFQP